LQVLINALVVSAVGVVLAAMSHGFRTEVREDLAGLRAELLGLTRRRATTTGFARS
jgi:hypothetical protein